MQEDYIKARKTGQREYREAISKGDYPYLPVLDEILKDNTSSEFPVGLMEIPMEFVVGTKTAGRTNAFSRDFMPLLEPDTEFARIHAPFLCSGRKQACIRFEVCARANYSRECNQNRSEERGHGYVYSVSAVPRFLSCMSAL